MKMKNMLKTLIGGLAATLISVAHAQTGATGTGQTWPTKPVRLVVGYAPGGVADITARMVAQKLSLSLGQQVIVENKPGAGLIAASDAVAKAEPDGHTLLHLNSGNAVSAALYRTLPFDTVRDFAPVSAMSLSYILVLTNKGSTLSSIKDVIAMAKSNPDKLNIGTVSIGSGQYMAASLFKAMTGLNLTIVPFKSTPALMTALKSNDIQVAFEVAAPVLSLVRSGDLRAIAISSPQRFETLPEVPTMMEAGVPAYQVTVWNGIAVPAKTPRAIIERLNREINAVLVLPDIRQRFADLGIDAHGGSAEELRGHLAGEIAKWKDLVETSKMEKQ
ncbi:MAG: tripartite tricarboxylate transporter substrate binding protein [Betaproteobacteria bacterium]